MMFATFATIEELKHWVNSCPVHYSPNTIIFSECCYWGHNRISHIDFRQGFSRHSFKLQGFARHSFKRNS